MSTIGFQLASSSTLLIDVITANSKKPFSALGHYLLFKNLDGSLTDSSYLQQSQVSAVSILLTTIFKSGLTASVGACFAQHLWLVLRGNATSVPLVEKPFVLRTNILAFGDMRGVQRAHILSLMALYIWCLGIATIHPLGAITVGLPPYTSTENMRVLVMNPAPPKEFEPEIFGRGQPYPTLANLWLDIVVDTQPGGIDLVQYLFLYIDRP